MYVAHWAPLSTEFSRQEYWNRLPLPTPRDLPDPGIESVSRALAGRFFTTVPPVQSRNFTSGYFSPRNKTLIQEEIAVQLLSCVQLFIIVPFMQYHLFTLHTPWTAASQAFLSFTISWSLLKLMSIWSVMLSNHLILCWPSSFCLQSFPATGSSSVSPLFGLSGQRTGELKNIYTAMFNTALFTITKIQKQPQCSSRDKWIRRCAYMYNGILLSHKKEWNLASCDNMKRPRGCYTKWNKSDREKQISSDFTYM